MSESENQAGTEEQLQSVNEISSETELQEQVLHQTEEQPEATETAENYISLSKEELVTLIENAITEDVNSVRQKINALKDAFEQLISHEREAALNFFIEEGGNKDDFEFTSDALSDRFYQALKKFNKRKIEFHEQQEKQREENFKNKQAILNDFKNLIQNEENMQRAFEQFHELQNRWRNTGSVPQAKAQDLWLTYKLYTDKFYELIKINRELQELDHRKNLEMKIQLCEMAEQLLIEPSLSKAMSQLGSLQSRWREVGPVSREKRNEIWDRFKTASDKIYERRREYNEEQKAKQVAHLEAKKGILEKAIQITSAEIKKATEWVEKTKELLALQTEFKTSGYVEKNASQEVWLKFKSVCDSFFQRKNEFFQTLKKEYAANMQLKTDLCVQAENLKNSTEWKKATEEIKQLQQEWKKIGNVGEKNQYRIWERFRAACDAFFENKKNHFKSLESEHQDNLLRKTQLIEEAEGYTAAATNDETIEQLKNFQRRWSEIGMVPFDKKDEIATRFKSAIDKHFNAIRSQQRQERKTGTPAWKFAAKTSGEKGAIHHKMNSLEHEVQTWENNLGFFAKSKNADALKKEFEEKINKAKEEIKKLKEQLNAVNAEK